MNYRAALITVICAAIGVHACNVYDAEAHGEAGWIMNNPAFKSESGIHCCGPSDCERAPENGVILQGGGYFIPSTGQFFPSNHPAVHPSKDGDYWWCKRIESDGNGGLKAVLRCLFVPLST
jgi:hypothetical protein